MKKYQKILKSTLLYSFLILTINMNAQVGIGTITPNSSAMLEINSNTKGLLLPRMTSAQISSISLPSKGLLVYQTDGVEGFYYNSGIPPAPNWAPLSLPPTASGWSLIGNDIVNSNTGNVGIGTTTPLSKLAIGNNSQFQVDLNGNLKKVNNVSYSFPSTQGLNGQSLINDGTGQLNWKTVDGIYTLTPSTFTTITVPANNYVKIDGSLTLSSDYSGLNASRLFINGGTINGNGTSILNIYYFSTIYGTNFNSVDINGSALTFINCSFTGNCPRLGSSNNFINCQFNGINVTSSVNLFDKCDIQNSTFANVGTIRNSTIFGCSFGSSVINNVINSFITNSTFTIISDNVFSNNNVRNCKLLVGNASQAPYNLLIANNSFDGTLSGYTDVIEISPISSYAKMYNIQGNNFTMQASDFSSIRIVGTEGNTYGYSSTTIQNNTFLRGTNILYYTGNMKVNFSNNTINSAGGTGTIPGVSGNLKVSNNVTF